MLLRLLFVVFYVEIVYTLIFSYLTLDPIHLVCKLSECANIKKKFIISVSSLILVLISLFYFLNFLSVIMMR